MRNRKSVWATLVLVCASWSSGGCIDGVALGVQGGVESAIATAIETIVLNALAPVLDNGTAE